MTETDVENNGTQDVLDSLISSLLIGGLGDLIGLVALFAVLVSVVRLYRSTNAPGVNFMYYSIVLTVIGLILMLVSLFFTGDDGQWVLDSVISLYLGLVTVLGAYGFWKLTNHIIEIHSNK
ncbi:MAG: hypothetical protein OEZ39_02610 [Gammaproteobacteria bacterium]|nr:hypothetical protein [Gammaproteobacteria bacterium]MDH5650747.1 hypothetical protein [Gammaproteobacteria bacterium]